MQTDNPNSIQAKLARLRERERAIAAQTSKLKKEMLAMDRKKEAQMLITLGRAWLSLGEQSSAGTRATMQRFLDGYISRPTDIEILKNTVWALSVPVTKTEPAYTPPEAAYDSDSQYA